MLMAIDGIGLKVIGHPPKGDGPLAAALSIVSKIARHDLTNG